MPIHYELPEQEDEDFEWTSDTEEALMATSMTINLGFAAFGLADLKTLSFTGTGGQQIDETVPASTSNHPVVFSLDVSAIKALYIVADGDLLLETNNSGTPDDAISLRAGEPYIWYTNSYFTNLLAADVTSLFFTNAAAAVVNVSIRVITDATP